MPVEFHPVARVIDTYSPPSTPTLGGPTINAGGGWQDLARSLSRFNAALMPFLEKVNDQLVEEELAEGARIQQEHRVAFKEAVRKGLIPEGANPYLKLGYLKSELRQKSTEYHAFLMEEWSKDGAIQNADVEAITDWTAQKAAVWRRENLAGYSDKLVAEVFDPAQVSAHNQLMQHHISVSFQRTSQRARDNLETEIAAIVTDGASQPAFQLAQALGTTERDEGVLRVRYVAQSVQALIDDAIANGMAPADANQISIAQIGAVADLRSDRKLLEALDHINAGSGPLGNTTAAKQMKLRIEERITDREIREENLYWSRRERERTEARRAAMTAAAKTMAETIRTSGVGALDPIAIYEASGLEDPELLSDLMTMAKGMASVQDIELPTDDLFVSEMRLRMLTDPEFDVREIHAGLVEGHYGSSVAERLYDDYEQSRPLTVDPRLNSTSFKTLRDGVGKAATDPISQGFGSSGLNSANAELDFTLAAMDFLRKNPEATEAELLAHMRPIARDIVKHYNEMGSSALVEPMTQQAAQQPATEAPQVAPEQPQTAVQPQPSTTTVAEQIAPAPQPTPVPAAQPAPAPTPAPAVTFNGDIATDIARLMEAFNAAQGAQARAAIMDLYDAKYGPAAAARVLGLLP